MNDDKIAKNILLDHNCITCFYNNDDLCVRNNLVAVELPKANSCSGWHERNEQQKLMDKWKWVITDDIKGVMKNGINDDKMKSNIAKILESQYQHMKKNGL